MAKIEISSHEIVRLAYKFAQKEVEEYLESFEAEKDSFKFTVNPDNIPVVNFGIPLKLQFLGYKENALLIQAELNSSFTPMNFMVNGVIKAIQKLFVKDDIVDGVILDGNIAHIYVNKFLDGQAIIADIRSDEDVFTVVAEV